MLDNGLLRVVVDGDGVRLALRPFELVTLRLTPAG